MTQYYKLCKRAAQKKSTGRMRHEGSGLRTTDLTFKHIYVNAKQLTLLLRLVPNIIRQCETTSTDESSRTRNFKALNKSTEVPTLQMKHT
jgi:hypothetical protein